MLQSAKRIFTLLGLVVLAWNFTAARTYIDVDGASFTPYPLAVQDSAGGNAAQRQVFLSVLRSDLEHSGYFDLLDPRAFLVAADQEGFDPAQVRWEAWQSVGAQGLLKPNVRGLGGDVEFSAELFDVAAHQSLFRTALQGPPDAVRALTHALADALVEFFVHEKGIFSTRIAHRRTFGAGRTKTQEIWVMDYDGNNAHNIVEKGRINLLPAWAPDTSGIAFTSYLNLNPDLFFYAFRSRIAESISSRPGLNSAAAFSPDGSKIALVLTQAGRPGIYVMPRNGGKPVALAQNDFSVNTRPSWSPDGRWIAFVSNRSGQPQIYVVPAAGGSPQRLTFKGTYNVSPAWSPRGDKIAFSARDERNVFDIFTIDVTLPAPGAKKLDVGTMTRLTQGQGNNEDPTFAPNGRMLAITSARGGKRGIWIISLDGTKQFRITPKDIPCDLPAWSPFAPK